MLTLRGVEQGVCSGYLPPVLDPTLALETGRALVIPATRVLTDVILSEARRREQG